MLSSRRNLASRKSHELPAVAEDEEQVALKGEQSSQTSSSGSQPSGGEGVSSFQLCQETQMV
jgi:hypothetical protein